MADEEGELPMLSCGLPRWSTDHDRFVRVWASTDRCPPQVQSTSRPARGWTRDRLRKHLRKERVDLANPAVRAPPGPPTGAVQRPSSSSARFASGGPPTRKIPLLQRFFYIKL